MLKIKGFFAPGLLSLSMLSLVACSQDIAEQPATEQVQTQQGNVELSLDLELSDEMEQDSTLLRSFNLYGGTNVGHRRPHIKIAKDESIKAYVYFAYADKGANNTPSGNPVLINTPFEVTFRANEAKVEGQGNNTYQGLRAINQTITIPNMANLRNKLWYVTGVIGATLKNGKLEFKPNMQLISKDKDMVAEREVRKVDIPYTFPWSPVKFSQVRRNGVLKDVAEVSGLRFKPRGLFLRFNVQNTGSNNGMYVLKSLLVPNQTDFATSASLNVKTPTRQDLTGAADFGFSKLVNTDETFSFKFGRQSVTIVTNPGTSNNTQQITVDAYAHYVGTKRVENPYIMNPNPRSGYFWLWLADVKSGASTLRLSVIGDPLGRLKPKQNFVINNLAIPANKKGISVARTLNLTKVRPYTPLEFVARGNAVRNSYGKTDYHGAFEVGPRYGYAGGSITGLWNAGATFGDTEVFDGAGGGLREKQGFTHDNRFIPTANDWRTIIPTFPRGTGLPSDGNDRQFSSENDQTSQVTEANDADVLSTSTSYKLFGTTPYTFIPLGKRSEFSRFRNPNGGYVDRPTTASYYRLNDNTIVGYRYVKHTESDFARRREYFCAYRIKFIEGNTGGLEVSTVYLGEETRSANGRTNPGADEDAWLTEIKKESFWTQRAKDDEVITRKFPSGGWYKPGTRDEGVFSRYFSKNRTTNNWNNLVDFEFTRDGWLLHLMYVQFGGTGANNLLLRYFVTDPGRAYEEWGSRN